MYITKFLDKLFKVTFLSYPLIGMGYYFATGDLYPYWPEHLIGIGLTFGLWDLWSNGYVTISKEELENYPSWVKLWCKPAPDGNVKIRRYILSDLFDSK